MQGVGGSEVLNNQIWLPMLLLISRLDYCNVLCIGLPMQYKAARLLTGTRNYEYITPALDQLQWLQICFQAQYKELFLTFKANVMCTWFQIPEVGACWRWSKQ